MILFLKRKPWRRRGGAADRVSTIEPDAFGSYRCILNAEHFNTTTDIRRDFDYFDTIYKRRSWSTVRLYERARGLVKRGAG